MTTYVCGLDEEVVYQPISPESARGFIEQWFTFYLRVLCEPVPFFPTSGYEFVKTGDMQKAINKFSGGQYIGFGECENPYVALDYNNLLEVESEFVQLSNELLKPVLIHGEEKKFADT